MIFVMYQGGLQGVGIAVGGVMARTLLRDCYAGKELHTASGYTAMALIVAPLMAPLLGGWLTDQWGWHYIFVFLLLYAFIVFLIQLLFFKETNKYIKQSSNTLSRYKTVFSSRNFIANMTYLLVVLSGVAVFEASCGAIFTGVMHLSASLSSVLFIVPLPAYILGSFVASKLNRNYSLHMILRIGLSILVGGALLMLTLALLGFLNLVVILLPASVYMLGAGIVFPTATTAALEEFPSLAGTAGAVLGGVQNIGAGVLTAIAALIPVHNQLPLAIMLVSLASIAATLYFIIERNEDLSCSFNE